MKIKKINYRVIVWLLIIICVGYSGYTYYKNVVLNNIFKPGQTKKVNLSGWGKLKKGMTKTQVISLLGESWHKSGSTYFHNIDGEDMIVPERWEYNWKTGLSLYGDVHPKAYVVYFDSDDRVSSWREPINKEEVGK